MPKLKNPNKSQLMHIADRKFSQYWIAKIGKCEKCGRVHIKLEVAHFKSRDYKCIRYSRDNTFVLCTACHFFFHKNPDLFKEFFIEKRGDELLLYLNKRIRVLKPLPIGWYKMQVDILKDLTNEIISDTLCISK